MAIDVAAFVGLLLLAGMAGAAGWKLTEIAMFRIREYRMLRRALTDCHAALQARDTYIESLKKEMRQLVREEKPTARESDIPTPRHGVKKYTP